MGADYLVANPLFIPGFRDICKAAISTDLDFRLEHSAFPPRQRRAEPSTSGNPFLKLPSELVQHIVHHLTPKDISSMRLSSQAFEHLPIPLWHRYFIEDFPFVYEAWCEEVQPNHWTYLNATQLRHAQNEQKEYEMEYNRRRDVIQQHEPDLLETWEANAPKYPPLHSTHDYKSKAQQRRLENTKLKPISLPLEKTNWYQLC